MPTGIRAVAWAAGAHAAAHTQLRDQDRPDGLGALRQKAAEVLDPSRRVQHHHTAPSPQQRGRHCHLGDVGRGLEREYAEHRAPRHTARNKPETTFDTVQTEQDSARRRRGAATSHLTLPPGYSGETHSSEFPPSAE